MFSLVETFILVFYTFTLHLINHKLLQCDAVNCLKKNIQQAEEFSIDGTKTYNLRKWYT